MQRPCKVMKWVHNGSGQATCTVSCDVLMSWALLAMRPASALIKGHWPSLGSPQDAVPTT